MTLIPDNYFYYFSSFAILNCYPVSTIFETQSNNVLNFNSVIIQSIYLSCKFINIKIRDTTM